MKGEITSLNTIKIIAENKVERIIVDNLTEKRFVLYADSGINDSDKSKEYYYKKISTETTPKTNQL